MAKERWYLAGQKSHFLPGYGQADKEPVTIMKEDFKFQSAWDASGVAAYLRELAGGLETGRLSVAEGGRDFSVRPKGLIDLGLKLRYRNGRTRLSLDLAWAENESPENGAGPG